jgi:type IV pilus assembly protein PilV
MRTVPNRMRGISLIEVLVSVLILGIGLLGIAAMQSLALRGGQSSLETSQAVMQTTAIIESMRANRANAASYNTAGMVCAAPGGAGLAGADLDAWIGSLKSTIGNDAATCGQIAGCPAACVITVQWNDTRAGGLANRTITTRTEI